MTFQVIGEFDKPVDTMGQGEVTQYSLFVPDHGRLVLHSHAGAWTPSSRRCASFRRFPRAARTVEDLLRERHHQGSVFDGQDHDDGHPGRRGRSPSD